MRILAVLALLFCSAAVAQDPPAAPTFYKTNVVARFMFDDMKPMIGSVNLQDVTAEGAGSKGTTVQTWTLDATGTIRAAVSLDTSHVYRADLIGQAGITRKSLLIFPAISPACSKIVFTMTLHYTFEADGTTYKWAGVSIASILP